MTFTLYVDNERWRAQQQSVLAEYPQLVPVVKGNGYGVGNVRLAAEAAALGVGAVAVGTEPEVEQVAAAFPGDVLVLTPVDSTTTYKADPTSGQVIRTVAAVEHLETLPHDARVVIECRTSMNRHGIGPSKIATVKDRYADLQVEGFALHLPIDRAHVNPLRETADWVERLRDSGVPDTPLWVSHLASDELGTLRERFPHVTFRPRIGTRLWLGDREALTARGTVLDVEPLSRGERSGYRQHPAPSRGHLVVVSGGTAHGVALEAPKAVRGVLPRARLLAQGTLEAVGRNLSPFTWAGKHRWFLEPPHMQVSLIFVPHQVSPPAVGTELDCQVRLTTTHPDRVVTLPD
jgi:hypothetical protein